MQNGVIPLSAEGKVRAQMMTETPSVPEVTLDDFADANGLILVVREHPHPARPRERFYASFARTEIDRDGVFRSAYGRGASPNEAIAEYARIISAKRLVVDDHTPLRREIDVPHLAEWDGGAPDVA